MTRPVSVTTYAGHRAITDSPADSPCAPSPLVKSDRGDQARVSEVEKGPAYERH